MFFYLLLLFTVVPLVELALLIRIGGVIGIGSTILLVVGTGVAGAALAKWQGLRTLRRIQEDLGRGVMPAAEMLDGLMILVAAAVLVTPGVLTDAFGFALLVPPFRRWLRGRVAARIKTRMVIFPPSGSDAAADRDVIDVDARVLDEDEQVPPPDSNNP